MNYYICFAWVNPEPTPNYFSAGDDTKRQMRWSSKGGRGGRNKEK